MPDSALPKNLQGRKHEDWIWPLSYIPRGWTAFKWKMPPKLLIGYNVYRYDTGEAKDIDSLVGTGGWVTSAREGYGANAIQKLIGSWRFGFHISYPFCIHFTIKLWKYKEPTPEELVRGYDGVRIIYGRIGARWDSWDAYYNVGLFIGGTYN